MKCQHVIAVSPAIVAAWTKRHVHQAAGTGDVKLLETDDLQRPPEAPGTVFLFCSSVISEYTLSSDNIV